VISTSIGDYTVTVILLTKETNFQWGITTTYAPLRGSLLRVCWREIRSIRLWWTGPRVFCGDFNALRKRSDKRGTSFDMRVSKHFNSMIEDLELIELSIQGKIFTWSNGRSCALLDRFFCSSDFESTFPLPLYC
jgi:hypothetical protein